jgi:hypothetical protein
MKKDVAPPPLSGVDIPLYYGRVFFTKKAPEWKAMHKWLEDDDEVDLRTIAGRTSQCADPRDGIVVMTIGVFDGSRATMAHECAHAAFYTLDRVGIDARLSDGEAFCYLLGWFMREGEKALFARKR